MCVVKFGIPFLSFSFSLFFLLLETDRQMHFCWYVGKHSDGAWKCLAFAKLSDLFLEMIAQCISTQNNSGFQEPKIAFGIRSNNIKERFLSDISTKISRSVQLLSLAVSSLHVSLACLSIFVWEQTHRVVLLVAHLEGDVMVWICYGC